jgi:hypothetical protein
MGAAITQPEYYYYAKLEDSQLWILASADDYILNAIILYILGKFYKNKKRDVLPCK